MRRLGWYWKLELANAALVPAFVAVVAHSQGEGAGWLSYVSLLPCCILLVIGGLYWRAKLHSLAGDDAAMRALLPAAAYLQKPLLIGSLGVIALVFAALLVALPEVTETDLWAGGLVAVLGLLEYVNYYHRQLQHFDHWPDFKRLFAGHGFRRAWMARDLAEWRRERSPQPPA
ncbi:MAG: hypothetical protein RIC51_06090 [Erythrobacter sp.]|uniref:hypothetical protein n=1 Tax=Erythrobacter sp. TaxID=1042 RepID=UPI0032EAAA96